MKPIHINLAARPYRDYRPIYAVVAALAIASAVLLFLNGQTALRYFTSTSETREEIARIEAETLAEKRRAESIDKTLAQIDITTLNAETTFINHQIAERTFGWSRLLDQLERVTPNDVKMLRLDPSVDRTGGTRLLLNCVAKDSNGIVRFLNRLIADPHFLNPFPTSEATNPDGSSRFNIIVSYVPHPAEIQR